MSDTSIFNSFKPMALILKEQNGDLVLEQETIKLCSHFSIHEKAQKRLAVIRTIFSRAPLNLGNKQASILEYLPTLRSICRSEKIKEQGKTKRR